MVHKNKRTKTECCPDRVCVQQNLIIELQVSKWNLCKNVYIKKCCSAWNAHCKISDEHEMWAKDRATGALYSPKVWKKTVQWTVQEVQPESGSPLWTSSKQDSN
jgi:hypothetical protein